MKSRPDRSPLHGARDAHGLVKGALLQFVLRSLAATALVAVATVAVAQRIAADEALDGARVRGETFANGVAAPLVTPAVRAGDGRAVARFADVMGDRLRLGTIAHMKLWDVDGTVLWSDDESLVGRRFAFPDPVGDAVGRAFVYAERSAKDRPEELAEQDEGALYEVYVGTHGSDGHPLVFETYWTPTALHVEQQRILWTIAPVSLGALALLLLALLPLGVSLAARLGRSITERGRLLRRSQAAADLERRRIAQTLHDGVIQDLAGLSYRLRSLARRLDGEAAPGLLAELDDATTLLKGDLLSLRSLLTETYPPDLANGGLEMAVADLADRTASPDLEVDVRVDEVLLPSPQARAAYRVVREGLLNVVRHSGARRAWVSIVDRGGEVVVEVADDGVGGSHVPIPGLESGHLGLRLLHDGIEDLGGTVELLPRPGGGTVLLARLPTEADVLDDTARSLLGLESDLLPDAR